MRGRWRGAVDLEEQLVGIAPPPVLAWFVGADQRMAGVGVPVGRGVPVRGVVTAADVAAGHAQAEVQPPTADAHAVLAAVTRRRDVGDGLEVRADLSHWQTS